MHVEALVERFFEVLITGDRAAARTLVNNAERVVGGPLELVTDLFWPTHQLIEKLYKADQLTRFNHHTATRLLRVLIDQNAAHMPMLPRNQKKVLAVCGPSENEELGAQMAVDLLEASGYAVIFAGSQLPADEVVAQVNETQPDVLMAFCSAAGDLPEIRVIIDKLKEIGAVRKTQFAVGGGVFNRAEGLAEEIGIDLWATSPMELVQTVIAEPARRAAAVQTMSTKTKKRAKAA